MTHILIVEDDAMLNTAICKHLSNHGFQVKGYLDAALALNNFYLDKYDLIISDIMMSHMDGFEFARSIRMLDKNIPILFMSARDDYVAKEKGFQIGIDDYMTKPLDLQELILRINALLRRAKIATSRKLIVGNLELDEDAVTASINGAPVELTLREFNILFKLLSYPNKTFTRGQLLDEFAGFDSDGSLRSVDVHITNLRQKLAACDGFQIHTVRGLGYKVVLL